MIRLIFFLWLRVIQVVVGSMDPFEQLWMQKSEIQQLAEQQAEQAEGDAPKIQHIHGLIRHNGEDGDKYDD